MTVKEYEELKNRLADRLNTAQNRSDLIAFGLISRSIIELENHARKYGFTDHKLED